MAFFEDLKIYKIGGFFGGKKINFISGRKIFYFIKINL